MSLLYLLGDLEDLSSLRSFLFDVSNANVNEWSPETWEWDYANKDMKEGLDLHDMNVAVSPSAEALVFSNQNKFVVFTSKVDPVKEKVIYSILYKGKVMSNDPTIGTEIISAIACIPVGSSQKTANGLTDFVCVVIGTSNGSIYFYTESGKLLFSQRFHDNSVQSIRCKTADTQKFGYRTEELVIVYEKEIVCLEAIELFQTLKACKYQLAGVQSSLMYEGSRPSSLAFKKWGIRNQTFVCDAVFVGITVTSSFDHLITASTHGGFNTAVTSSPPLFYVYVAGGKDPTIAFHLGQEGASNFALSQVAVDLAGKVTSALFSAAGSFFGRPSIQEQKVKPPKIEYATPTLCRLSLQDSPREVTSMSLSPNSQLVATVDTLGRIVLIDTKKGEAVRIWKGYRNAECGWFEARKGTKSVLYLVIHVPKRGLLEVWLAQNGGRIYASNVMPLSRLVYPGYGLVNLIKLNEGILPLPYKQIFLLSPDGTLSSVNIPYEQATMSISNVKNRDKQILDNLKKNIHSLKETELLGTLQNFSSSEYLSKALEVVLVSSRISCDLLQKSIQIVSKRCDEELNDPLGRLTLHECERLERLISLFLNLEKTPLELAVDDSNFEDLAITEEEKDALAAIAMETHPAMDSTEVTVNRFISCFEGSTGVEHHNSFLKSNISDTEKKDISVFLFGKFFCGQVSSENLHSITTESWIAIESILDLFLVYWFLDFPVPVTFSRVLDLLNCFFAHFEKYNDSIEKIKSAIKESKVASKAFLLSVFVRNLYKDTCAEKSEEVSQDNSSPDSPIEWEGFSVSYVEWDMLCGRMYNVLQINQLISLDTSMKVSLKDIEIRGRGSVSEIVSQYLILNNLDVLKTFDSIGDSDKESDKRLQNLKKLKELLPYSLEKQRICCLSAIEYLSSWIKTKNQIGKLHKSLKCLTNLENAYLRHGTAKIMWSTSVCPLLCTVASMIDGSSKINSKDLTKFESGECTFDFIKFCEGVLAVSIEAGSQLATETLPFFKFDESCKNGAMPFFERAVQQRSINFDLALLHKQLCAVLELIAYFDLKNVKIFSLFDSETQAAFFVDLGSYPMLRSGEPSSAIRSRRVQFLKRCLIAIVNEVNDKQKRNDWLRYVLDLSKVWHCFDDDFIFVVLEALFSSCLDEEAYELSLSVNRTHSLGKMLLEVGAKRLNYYLLKHEENATFLSLLQPKVSSWLQSQGDLETLAKWGDICALFSKASSLLSADSFEYGLCHDLDQAAKDMLE
ncbi:rab3 GTPase-activating protein non-catalytic subunit-like [Artemia franciscana]|uniref:rab3 GTPase-activating protein non-catalytic subunit-like n=1 Tax=Artemia franciscana TaxID=6661 RepID=UPI0032DAC412